MLHFEVEAEVAYELSSRLHYLITLFTRFIIFFFYLVIYYLLYYICNFIVVLKYDIIDDVAT